MGIDADNLQKHGRTLVDLLRQRAALQADREAFTYLVDGETEEISLTYRELDRRARGIAAQLQAHTVPGDRALILCPPGLDYIAALYSCFYAGVVAIPFYPPNSDGSLEALSRVLEVAEPAAAISTRTVQDTESMVRARISGRRRLHWMIADSQTDGAEHAWRKMPLPDDGIACLYMTSGSTAMPRGVVASHASLMHDCRAAADVYRSDEGSRVVSWLPLHFSFSVAVSALRPVYGGYPAMLLPTASVLQQPIRWLRAIASTHATHSVGSNFAYDLAVRSIGPEERASLALHSWRAALCGGEMVRPDTLRAFAAAFEASGFRWEAFCPAYGSSEGSLITTSRPGMRPAIRSFQSAAITRHRVTSAPDSVASTAVMVGCGPSMPEEDLLIVDPERLERCAPDQVGEIWVAGPNVAQGYWNQPEETNKTFHAFLATGEGPFLRTGDLGFLWEGELFITGRLKELIIIRGRNLYPQDIERTVQASHQALVPNSGAAFSVEVGGEERLVVAQEVAPDTSNLEGVVAAIRRAVMEQHQVQVYAVILIPPETLPKTGSGKIQRTGTRSAYQDGRLPVVAENILVGRERPALQTVYAPAETATQAALVAVWEEVLGIRGIGIHDHFAELGGDSLLSMQVLARANQTGLGLTAELLARAPTIAELGELVGHATSVDAEQGAVSGPAPMTPRQSLAFERPDRPKIERFIAPVAVELPSDADPAIVERAVRAVVEHHDALRMRITRVGDRRMQINAPQEDRDIFSVVDVGRLSKTDRQTAIRLAVAERERAIDLANGPVVQAVLVHRGAHSASLLFMLVHHFVTDALSSSILVEDLLTAYRQLEQGQAVALPLKTTSVKTWSERLAVYAQSPQAKDELNYWLSVIPRHNPAPLPGGEHVEASALGTDGAVAAELSLDETIVLLRDLPPLMGAQLNEAVITALITAFRPWTRSSTLFLNLVVHGRTPLFDDVDVSRTVGWFAAMFPALLSVEGASNVREELASVREALRAVPNGGVGFGALRYLCEDSAIARQLEALAVPEVKFNYQGQPHRASPGFSRPGAESEVMRQYLTREVHLPHRDMEIQANVQGDTLRLLFLFHRGVYSRSSIERLAERTTEALRRIVAECQVMEPARAGA